VLAPEEGEPEAEESQQQPPTADGELTEPTAGPPAEPEPELEREPAGTEPEPEPQIEAAATCSEAIAPPGEAASVALVKSFIDLLVNTRMLLAKPFAKRYIPEFCKVVRANLTRISDDQVRALDQGAHEKILAGELLFPAVVGSQWLVIQPTAHSQARYLRVWRMSRLDRCHNRAGALVYRPRHRQDHRASFAGRGTQMLPVQPGRLTVRA
jgi:hypothetical protein